MQLTIRATEHALQCSLTVTSMILTAAIVWQALFHMGDQAMNHMRRRLQLLVCALLVTMCTMLSAKLIPVTCTTKCVDQGLISCV